jgi:hypothetical protein
MKTFIYLFLLSQAVFLISCGTKKRDFSVKAPRGWEITDSVSETFGRTVKMHPPVISTRPIFVENIIVSIINFPRLDIYRSTTLENIKSEAMYFKEKGTGSEKINGYEMEWEHHIIQKKKTDIKVEQKVYFVWYKGNIYQIVCSTNEKQMEEFQFLIDQVLNSFRILE